MNESPRPAIQACVKYVKRALKRTIERGERGSHDFALGAIVGQVVAANDAMNRAAEIAGRFSDNRIKDQLGRASAELAKVVPLLERRGMAMGMIREAFKLIGYTVLALAMLSIVLHEHDRASQPATECARK